MSSRLIKTILLNILGLLCLISQSTQACTASINNRPIKMGGIYSEDIPSVGQKSRWVSLPTITFSACTAQSKVKLQLNSRTDQGHIALASISGIAIGLSADDLYFLDLSKPIEVDRYWLPGNQAGTFTLSLKAAFVRTQPVISLGAINTTPSFTLTAESGDISPSEMSPSFVGMVCANGCRLQDNVILPVELGAYASTDFPQMGSRSPKKRFAIRLTGCLPDEKLSLTFTSSGSGATQGLLNLNQDKNSASGLGVGIARAGQEQLLNIGTETSVFTSDTNGQATVEFDAFYQRIGTISGGPANTSALITINHK